MSLGQQWLMQKAMHIERSKSDIMRVENGYAYKQIENLVLNVRLRDENGLLSLDQRRMVQKAIHTKRARSKRDYMMV